MREREGPVEIDPGTTTVTTYDIKALHQVEYSQQIQQHRTSPDKPAYTGLWCGPVERRLEHLPQPLVVPADDLDL